MKKWVIILLVAAVVIAAAVLLWPRSNRRRFEFHNTTGVKLRVTVERLEPRTNTQTLEMGSAARLPVDYRFSKDEMTKPHRVLITVTRRDGSVLVTQAYEGKAIYGRLLVIRRDGIHISEERIETEE